MVYCNDILRVVSRLLKFDKFILLTYYRIPAIMLVRRFTLTLEMGVNPHP